MKFKSFLIKYAEIGVKGKNRFLFEDALVRQINLSLKNIDDARFPWKMCETTTFFHRKMCETTTFFHRKMCQNKGKGVSNE